MSERINAVLDQIEAMAEVEVQVETAKEYIDLVVQGKITPTPMRLRAAIEKLKYEEPQLAKASQYPEGEDVGSRLDRAIERSHGKPGKLLLMDLRNRASPDEPD
jgi:hypothetical protein